MRSAWFAVGVTLGMLLGFLVQAAPAHAADVAICTVTPSLVYPGPLGSLSATGTVKCNRTVMHLSMEICVQEAIGPTVGRWDNLDCTPYYLPAGKTQGPSAVVTSGCRRGMWYRTWMLAGQTYYEARASVIKISLPRQVQCTYGLV